MVPGAGRGLKGLVYVLGRTVPDGEGGESGEDRGECIGGWEGIFPRWEFCEYE